MRSPVTVKTILFFLSVDLYLNELGSHTFQTFQKTDVLHNWRAGMAEPQESGLMEELDELDTISTCQKFADACENSNPITFFPFLFSTARVTRHGKSSFVCGLV